MGSLHCLEKVAKLPAVSTSDWIATQSRRIVSKPKLPLSIHGGCPSPPEGSLPCLIYDRCNLQFTQSYACSKNLSLGLLPCQLPNLHYCTQYLTISNLVLQPKYLLDSSRCQAAALFITFWSKGKFVKCDLLAKQNIYDEDKTTGEVFSSLLSDNQNPKLGMIACYVFRSDALSTAWQTISMQHSYWMPVLLLPIKGILYN